DPDQQLRLNDRIMNRQQDKADEGDAGHAVGFEPVGGRADGIAGVVTDTVGDDTGVAGVVFLDVEDDLHEISADVGDLGKDAARDAKGSSAQRFANRKADEARSGQVRRNKQENQQHHQQL